MMKIGTIASHSALNIISGARHEGFETALYCKPDRLAFYRSFGFGDSIIEVSSFEDILTLDTSDVVMIPHGSFVAYIGAEKIIKSDLRIFGNKQLLRWEEDRALKNKMMTKAGFKVPREFTSVNEIHGPVIAKTSGAAGGKGYFIANSKDEVLAKMDDKHEYTFQNYIVGTKIFVTYFRSLAHDRVEIFSADIRYETDADANLRFDDRPSFLVVGNLPMVLRESILAKYFDMGVAFIDAYKRLLGEELVGPFCLETVIDKNQHIYTFEFSGRIVAGTNIWIPYSPYSFLQYNEPVWMGRRIAMEIRDLMDQDRLEDALS